MIYYKDRELIIRNMEEADAQVFYEGYLAQGWHPDISVYEMRLKHQTEGKCIALTAVYQGQPAGSVYVYLTPHDGPFKGKDWPEIHDFNVLKKYQRKGIGNKLMDAAEQIAGQYADTVCLGVGLCDSYGTAQRMYIKRGYIPDGSGVWYQGRQCKQYETVCTVDDDLILFLSKKLTGVHPAGNARPAGTEEEPLKTDQIILRFVTEDDLSEVARTWPSDHRPVSKDEARGAISYMLDNRAKNAGGCIYHLCLAVCRAEDPGTIMGWCGLDGRRSHTEPEIFILLDEEYRNKGYGTQCVKELLRMAAEEYSLRSVHGGCARDNIASRRAMEKGGMIQYGTEDNGDPVFRFYAKEKS